MIDFEAVKITLYGWANTVLNIPAPIPPKILIPVIFWQPNAPRPETPYVTLYIENVVSVGQDWANPEADVNGEVNQKGDRQFTLSIQAFGSDPLTILENIRTSLQKQSVLDILRAGGVTFFQALNILEITGLVDSEFERRASLDVLLGIGQVYKDAPGYFSTAEVEQNYLDSIANIVYDETITISAP